MPLEEALSLDVEGDRPVHKPVKERGSRAPVGEDVTPGGLIEGILSGAQKQKTLQSGG